MEPLILHHLVPIGTDFRRVLALTKGGIPVPLAGFTAHLHGGDLLDLNLTVNGTAGTIEINLPRALTEAMNFGSRAVSSMTLRKLPNGLQIVGTGYLQDYRLDLTAPNGTVYRLFVGTFIFSPEA